MVNCSLSSYIDACCCLMTRSFSSNCLANRDSISDCYLSWMASLSDVFPAPPPDLCAVFTPLKLSEPSVSLTGDLDALIGCICLSSEPVDFFLRRLLDWCLSLPTVSLGFKSSPKFWLDFLNVNLWFRRPFWLSWKLVGWGRGLALLDTMGVKSLIVGSLWAELLRFASLWDEFLRFESRTSLLRIDLTIGLLCRNGLASGLASLDCTTSFLL